MKWKDVPDSWFGFPGKCVQFVIDNALGVFGKDPDKGDAMDDKDYELICPKCGGDLKDGKCQSCGWQK